MWKSVFVCMAGLKGAGRDEDGGGNVEERWGLLPCVRARGVELDCVLTDCFLSLCVRALQKRPNDGDTARRGQAGVGGL